MGQRAFPLNEKNKSTYTLVIADKYLSILFFFFKVHIKQWNTLFTCKMHEAVFLISINKSLTEVLILRQLQKTWRKIGR